MLPVVHIYIDRSEAETWNYDEIDNLQGKINTGEYSMSKVIIIGGGAAGMMAGVFAARNHHEVHILEKNEKLGKKVFITNHRYNSHTRYSSSACFCCFYSKQLTVWPVLPDMR